MTAAVFDLDGTLVRSDDTNRVAWRAFFAARDLELSDELLEGRILGRRGVDVFAELAPLFPGERPADLNAEVLAMELAAGPEPSPVAGAVELVRRLHRDGVPLALVTSAPMGFVRARLEPLGLLHLFPVVVTAEDVRVGKPDPEGYLAGCAGLGVAPAEAVGFEDSPAGVAAVKAAGMRCVAVATNHPPADLAAADFVVPDLTAVQWPV